MATLALMGKQVEAADYEKLKTLATVFFGELPIDIPQRMAEGRAVAHALHVLASFRESL